MFDALERTIFGTTDKAKRCDGLRGKGIQDKVGTLTDAWLVDTGKPL